jgi:hypothetical protein
MSSAIAISVKADSRTAKAARDLRFATHARELETQLMEVIDSIGDFFRFIESSTSEIANNQRRLFKDGCQRLESMENWRR